MGIYNVWPDCSQAKFFIDFSLKRLKRSSLFSGPMPGRSRYSGNNAVLLSRLCYCQQKTNPFEPPDSES
jgi:hypothetical protein